MSSIYLRFNVYSWYKQKTALRERKAVDKQGEMFWNNIISAAWSPEFFLRHRLRQHGENMNL